MSVRPNHSHPTEAHQWLSRNEPPGTAIVELPVPEGEALWLYETTYQIRSTHHWLRLVNGYSGFAPEEYRRTLEDLRAFPDTRSIERLRQVNVRFVLIDRVYYSEEGIQQLARPHHGVHHRSGRHARSARMKIKS